MTKSKVKSEDCAIDAVDYVEEIDSDLELSEEVKAVLSELGEDAEQAKLSVYRPGKGRKTIWLFTVDEKDIVIDEIMENLRDNYGGGEFRLQLRLGGRLRLNRVVEIEPPRQDAIKDKFAEFEDKTVSIFSELKNNNRDGGFSETMALLMNMQQEQARQQNEMLLQLLKRDEKPAEKSTTVELIETMTMLKALTSNDSKSDDLSVFLKGMEFGKEISADSNESPLLTAFKTLSENVGKMQLPNIQNARPNIKSTENGDHVKKAEKIEPKSNTNTKENKEMLRFIDILPYRHLIPVLTTAVQSNADPDIYANMICDQLPLELIDKYVIQDNGWSNLMGLIPGEIINNSDYQRWFFELRSIITGYVTEPAIDSESDNVFSESESEQICESHSAIETGDYISGQAYGAGKDGNHDA